MTALPNPFLNSGTPPSTAVPDTAAADQVAPQVAAAGTISESTLDPATGVETVAGPDLTDPPVPAAVLIDEPSSNEGRPKSAPALDAPNTHDDAGATDCISEIFHYARKLMKQPPAFVLDEAAFMAEVDEEPLFLREDGYLQRREA